MKIHFIGIGGIGMSSLAQYYLAQDFLVSGSDVAASEITDDLAKKGVKIFIGHRAENIPYDLDLIIYTAAVDGENPEIKEVGKNHIKCLSYAKALGELTKEKWTIAISGTHGKSTTTAMLGLILEEAGLDPTVILGTKVKEWGGNFRLGKSKYLVIEADEYSASFLNYWPKMAVLTNIEADHLDFYKDLEEIVATFKKYISHLDEKGFVVANEEDANVVEVVKLAKAQVKNFSLDLQIKELNLQVPGRHNLANAAAAIEAARILEVPDEISMRALNKFNGTWRRMEFRGELNGAKIFDDYAHHPTEIKAALQGAREILPEGGRLFCVFQPHQYQRTYSLFEEFADAFDAADNLILLPIYSVAGRENEEIKKMVSSQKLAEAVNKKNQKAVFIASFKEAENYLKQNLKQGDIAMIMGAGDVYLLKLE